MFIGELKHSLSLSKPKFVFTSPYTAKLTIKVCKSLNYVEKVIVFGKKQFDNGSILFDDFIKKYEKKDFNVEEHVTRRISRDQVAYIASSSGTTGLNKTFIFRFHFNFVLFITKVSLKGFLSPKRT